MVAKYRSVRTALFVPGNRPERVDKAMNSGADAVVIDLEDAVPLSLKRQTRAIVCEKILQYVNKNLIVRVNALDSEFIQGDLDEVVVEGLSCIMVPKVETDAHIREIHRLLLEVEGKKGLPLGTVSVIPLIETAQAVQNIFSILSEKTEPQRLWTAAFGAADYTLDMGVEMTAGGKELFYPRSRIAVACRAAGVHPPIDSPYMIDLKDRAGLEADSLQSMQLGFQGKLCIHPNQVELCNQLFSPSENEIQYAQKVIQAFEAAENGGQAAIQVDGKFVDYPIVERARRIVKIAALMTNEASC